MLIRLGGKARGYVNSKFITGITFSLSGEANHFFVYIWTYGDSAPFVEQYQDKESAHKRIEELRKMIEKSEP